jgi:hypothetical protein
MCEGYILVKKKYIFCVININWGKRAKAADKKLTTLALSDKRTCSFCPTPLKEVKNEMAKCLN